LVVAAVMVVVAWVTGEVLRRNGVVLHLLGGAVLRGSWSPRFSVGVLLPVGFGLVGLAMAPGVSRRLSWPALLPAAGAGAALWAVSLALVDGVQGLTKPLSSRYEYLYDVDRVGSWSALLDGFVADIPADVADPWTTHVAGHPPLALLVFAGLDQIGLGGTGWASTLCILAGASAVPAVLVAVRAVVDEGTARSVAPFLVLAPFALWIATSADAFFLGVSAWGIAALALAARRPDRAGVGFALLGGVLLGAALFLSYGLVLLGPLACAVVLCTLTRSDRRAWRVLALGAVGVLAVVAVFAVAGFWWLDGLWTTIDRVSGGPAARDRPAAFFVVANLAAAAIALGPAGAGALGPLITRSVRRTTTAVLPLAALAGILVADLSLLSKGEVERIYLPFFPWILTATVLLDPGQRTRWLGAQVVAAIVVQVLIRTEW